ncbi:hypothetical protein CES86_1662 [Brucella lupini]|uniref:Uncharacterized protein n=1 Tax=Brucella lupini TaxID=255457 RepID=A0A256GTM1_9HYPH|nr:hypothetical protein CES86_1662 [Brucella lupini]
MSHAFGRGDRHSHGGHGRYSRGDDLRGSHWMHCVQAFVYARDLAVAEDTEHLQPRCAR